MPSLEKFVTHVEYSTLPLKDGTGSPASKAASAKSGGGSSAGSDDGADGSGAGGSDDVPGAVRAATSLDSGTANVRPSDVARDFTRKLAAAVAAGINGSNAANDNKGAAVPAAATMTTGEKEKPAASLTGLERRAQDAQKMAQAAKNMVQNSSQGPTNGKRARGDENDASGPAAKRGAQHPPVAAAEVQAPRANEAEHRLKMMEQLLQMEEIASQTRRETEHCLQMQEYLASQKQKAGAAATLARPPPAPGMGTVAAHEDAEGAGAADGAALRNKVQEFLLAQEAALARNGKKKAAGGEVIELDDDSGDESEDAVPLTKKPASAPVGDGQEAPTSSTASTGAAASAPVQNGKDGNVHEAPTSSTASKKAADSTPRAGSTAVATAMVLPEVHTEALWEKMQVLSAQIFAPLSIADRVPALSDALLGAIALRVPVSSEELREYGLSEEQVRLFGKIVIRNICEFVRERGLEMHLLSKHPASNFGNGVAGTYGRNNNFPVQAPTAQPRHAFPVQQQFPRPNAGMGIGHANPTAHARTQPAPQPTTQTAAVVHSNIPNKALERWSEYRIDAASTVEDLESIRRRLLSLVDRVDVRLRERRLVDAMTQMGGAGTENFEELSTQELIDRLSAKVEDPSEGEVGDTRASNGQRQADEASGGEIASDERQRLPTTCPLCFDKIASPASCGTCEICKEKGICGQCHSTCSCCRRSTCADCLMGCDGCSSRHHCSDCMMYGGGKCVVCRPKKSVVRSYAQIPDGTLSQKMAGRPTKQRGSNHVLSSLTGRANGTVGYPQFYPPTKPLALPPAPGPPQNNAFPPKPNASVSRTQTTANGIKTTQGYSIHRFIISEAGTIGINITVQTKTRKCVISTVHPGSLALKYGIQVNDEIIPPNSNGRVDPTMDVYKLFLEAAKHRPLIFEVKRLFNPASAAASYPLEGSHALHKFVISEPGLLGLTVQKSCGENHYISPISSVTPDSLSALYGLKVGDVICKTGTNGREKVIVFDWFLEGARSGKRPLVIEVWRALSASAPNGARQTGQKIGGVNGNPFIFSFPTSNQPARIDAANGKAAGNAQPTKPATASKGKDNAPIILLDGNSDSDSGSDTESTSDKRSSWRCNYCPRLFDEYDDAMNHELTCEQRDDSNGEEKKND